jgi:hypothetical protein
MMRGTRSATWAVLAAVGMVLAWPVLADDPPAAGKGGSEATGTAAAETRGAPAPEPLVEDVRAGAGSMEPGEAEASSTAEEQAEQRFAESVWTSP